MGKKFNSTFFITTILCFVPMILGIVLWDKLPSELPMNYGFNNEIRHLAPKWVNVILLPIIFAVLNIIKSISMTEKDIENIGRKLSVITVWIIPIMSVLIGTFMIIKPIGLPIEASFFVIFIMSLLFIIIGNYIPKCKPNHIVGFRISCTMKNEEVWNKIHRFSGYLLVVCGFINFVTSFFEWGKYVFIATLGVIIFIPLIYSSFIKKKFDTDKSN